MKIELIEWRDHCSLSGGEWNKADEVMQLTSIAVHTVGMVVKENREEVVLVPTITDQSSMYGEICIIKKCINWRRSLGTDSKDGE